MVLRAPRNGYIYAVVVRDKNGNYILSIKNEIHIQFH